MLSAIAALSANRVIGQKNQLPWHLPADLKHFKALTLGKPILMGRKTFESIGRPLPLRHNIILTSDPVFKAEGCTITSSLDSALSLAQPAEEVMVIGGATLYEQLLPRIQRLYLTVIHHSFEGDAYFPELEESSWREISREDHEADADNAYSYSFLVLERK